MHCGAFETVGTSRLPIRVVHAFRIEIFAIEVVTLAREE
jgi:hypothetical protein